MRRSESRRRCRSPPLRIRVLTGSCALRHALHHVYVHVHVHIAGKLWRGGGLGLQEAEDGLCLCIEAHRRRVEPENASGARRLSALLRLLELRKASARGRAQLVDSLGRTSSPPAKQRSGGAAPRVLPPRFPSRALHARRALGTPCCSQRLRRGKALGVVDGIGRRRTWPTYLATGSRVCSSVFCVVLGGVCHFPLPTLDPPSTSSKRPYGREAESGFKVRDIRVVTTHACADLQSAEGDMAAAMGPRTIHQIANIC